MNDVDGPSGAVVGGSVSTLQQRLSKVMFEVSSSLADSTGGALVQVWMPEHCAGRPCSHSVVLCSISRS